MKPILVILILSLVSAQAAVVDSGTGLVLTLDGSGNVTAVGVNGVAIPVVGNGGFLAKDFAGSTPYVAASSTVTPITDGFSLAGSVGGFNLDLAATIITNNGNIAIVGSITNTVGGTRAIAIILLSLVSFQAVTMPNYSL